MCTFVRAWLLQAGAFLAFAFGAGSNANAGLGTAIEYYNPALRHYFITAYPEEATALDAGINVKGWVRTGGQFTVFTEPAEGLSPVCRFFGTPGLGLNSHFYTASVSECAKVKTLPAWTFEAIAFYIPLPVNDQCGANYPVYRSFYSDNVSDTSRRRHRQYRSRSLAARSRQCPRAWHHAAGAHRVPDR